MNLTTALDRIDELSVSDLKHCIQLMDVTISSYEKAITNYPLDRMNNYGIPFLKRLKEQRKELTDKLKEKS